MMMPYALLASMLVTLLATRGLAQTTPKTASFRANTASLSVGEGSVQTAQFGTIGVFFTTPDGTSRFPLAQNIGGSPYFGRELRYFPGANLPFQTDYTLVSSVGAFEYGTIGLNLQLGDGNLDRIPDILQPEFTGTGGFNGQAAPDAGGVAGYTVGGFMTREAGSQRGTYTINLNGSAAGRLSFTGEFSLVTWRGAVSYERGPLTNTAYLDLTQTKPDGSTNSYSGPAFFTVQNVNQITFGSFTLTNAIGQVLQAGGAVLNRNGTHYVGGLELADGDPLTSWQDYSNLYVDIADTNDANGDGIPDLSSNYDPPPTITQHPSSVDLAVGATATFTVGFETVSSASIQWSLNGVILLGARSSSLVIENVQLSQSGAYAARITNRGGTVTTANAVLTVLVPPLVASDPVSQVLDEGSTANLSVGVTGSLPIAYQWRFNGTNIPAATTPLLTLTNLTAATAGNYDVVVTNRVGKVTSAVAKLVVNTAPLLTVQPKPVAVLRGGSATFRVVASGVAPLRYQWRHFGTNIPGALSAELRLSDVQPAHAGPYEVLVSNRLGDTVSESGSLTVLERLLTTARASDSGLQVLLSGETGKQYALEASTNLVQWLVLTNSSSTNTTLLFLEPNIRALPRRFYRARAL